MSEEIGLPKATILNLIKECLESDTRISNEANDIVLSMASNFVNHLSSVSNDICLEGGKKTISQQHVAEAMKKLKFNSYLAKIMNVEDSKELEDMSDKKRKEILNTSLNVSRKKKKGLTPEEEEELRKKQASLFQNDQNSSMYPGQTSQTESTPTFPPAPQGPFYAPNDPKFYDGSITQVLANPSINPALQAQPEGGQGTPAPTPTNGENQKEEEEVIDTSMKGSSAEPTMAQKRKFKILLNWPNLNI